MDTISRVWSEISRQYASWLESDRSLFDEAVELILQPVRIATSQAALRAYVSILVFFFSSATLISISTTAYLVFYYNFIPQINLEKTVYLQYGHDSHPHATVALQTEALIPQQPYDVEIVLHMPLSPINLAAGNFMLDVALLTNTDAALASQLSYIVPNATWLAAQHPVYRSRRPTMLPYASHITGLTHTLLHLPTHLLKLRDVDSATLVVPMFEHVSFPRGRQNVPTHAYIEIQSQVPPAPASDACAQQGFSLSQGLHVVPPPPAHIQTRTLQIYDAKLKFRARFKGLRYIVYNYRVISFLLFTTMFYLSAITSMAAAWVSISKYRKDDKTASANQITPGTKKEGGGAVTTGSGNRRGVKTEMGTTSLYDIPPEGERREQAGDGSDSSDLGAEEENGNHTDTSTVFPGLGRTIRPMRYAGSGSGSNRSPPPGGSVEDVGVDSRPNDDPTHDAEDEDEEGEGEIVERVGETGDVYIKDEEDNDNDEEDARLARDSGIGTSMESEHPASLVRRRSGRGRGGGR